MNTIQVLITNSSIGVVFNNQLTTNKNMVSYLSFDVVNAAASESSNNSVNFETATLSSSV